jgi:hypothetical protein
MDTPDLSFIDVQARKLIYQFSEARRWEMSPVQLWVYQISVDRKSGDIYFPHPILNVNHTMCKLRSIKMLVKPPEEVWIMYDKKQQEYKEKLRKKNLSILDRIESELGEVKATTYDPAKYKNKFNRWDKNLIKLHLNISMEKAKEIKAFIDK